MPESDSLTCSVAQTAVETVQLLDDVTSIGI